MPSSDGTVVNYPGPVLYDASNEAFTLVSSSSNYQVAVNGITDSSLSGVTQILYEVGRIYAQVNGGAWWYKTVSTAVWTGPVSDPRNFSPASPSGTAISSAGPTLTDASGETVTLVAATTNFSIAFNGTTDTGITNVTQAMIFASNIWAQVNGGVWSSKASSGATWTNNQGDPRNWNTSADQTAITPGNGTIADALGNVWTITSGGLVQENGSALPGGAGMSAVEYYSGVIYLQDASNGGWMSWNGTTLALSSTPAGAPTATATPTPTSTPAGTRAYWDQPGTNANVWNTPFGDGCTWGSATDSDTIDLRHGGYINAINNHGSPVWVNHSATAPTASFSGTMQNYAQTGQYAETGTPYSVTAHCVTGSYSAGSLNDQVKGTWDDQYGFVDTVKNPGMYWQFAPCTISDFEAGQGPFNCTTVSVEDAMSDNFSEDQETGHCGDMCAAGMIRAYDLDPARNPARIPGMTNVTRIQHGLRYAHDAKYFKSNARNDSTNPDYPNGFLNYNAWPANYQDYQNGINIYTGNLLYGTTVGIPFDTVIPANNPLTNQPWTNAGLQLIDNAKRYPWLPRDQAGGGLHLTCDQDVSGTQWWSDANTDLPAIVQYLCPLRNQHQGNTTRAGATDINGPGTRRDTGPPPLAPLTATTPIANVRSQVLALLNNLSGTGTISGQFIERGGDSTFGYAAIVAIQASTTYWLGMIGGDYWYDGSTQQTADTTFNQYAKTYWAAGGLITLTLSMPNPTTGKGHQDTSSLNADDITDTTTATGTAFKTTMDSIASALLDLQNSGVGVILRPFHENNGNWFWWGTGRMSDAQFVKMWQYFYNYLMTTKGLTNLVWLDAWNAGITSGLAINQRYPGDAYCDMVGIDAYTDDISGLSGDYTYCTTNYPSQLFCLAEFGSGSAAAGDTNFDEKTLINTMKSTLPKAVFFQQWWSANAGGAGWGLDEVQNAGPALGLSWVKNRGSFTLPTSTTATPTPTPTPSPSPTPTPTPTSIPYATPGAGSFADGAGNVYTLTSNGTATENGAPMNGGGGTAMMEYYNGTVYAQDAATQGWYTWNGTSFVAATSAPPSPSTPTPTPSPTPTPTPTPVPVPIPTPTPIPSPTPVTTHVTTAGLLTDEEAVRDATTEAARRLAVISLARAAAAYQPTSYQDAQNLLTLVTAALDQEITIAGDEGDDATYTSLVSLKNAVVQDLTTRAATLPQVTTWQSNAPLPTLTVGQIVYQDASRSDQIAAEADAAHPAFAPTSIQLLSN